MPKLNIVFLFGFRRRICAEFNSHLDFFELLTLIRCGSNSTYELGLRAWSSTVECEPGFLATVLESLSEKAKDAGNDWVLLLDEIAIKKETVWDEKKCAGTCDCGFMKAEEPDSAAQNALFLMAVGMKKPWSYPLGYFLTNKMSSDVLTQIVLNGINLLTEAGMEVHAVPFDGCAKNLACA